MHHVFAVILHRVQAQAFKTSHTRKINTKTAMIYIKKVSEQQGYMNATNATRPCVTYNGTPSSTTPGATAFFNNVLRFFNILLNINV